MDGVVFTKTYPAPPVSPDDALRYAGAAGSRDPEVLALMASCARLAEGHLTYRVCWGEFPVSWDGDVIDLGFTRTGSASLRRRIEGCDAVVLFAATVGISIDRLIARYSAVSPAKSLMLQGIGAERVEALCDAFCADIDAEARERGRFTRPRFSPGYGDLPLDTQRDVFRALDCPKRIGVALNDSLLMSPSKSVTGIIGVGAAMAFDTEVLRQEELGTRN